MINLLPPETKAEIRAARTNTIMSRYIGILLAAILFSVGILYLSYSLLTDTMKSAQSRIASVSQTAPSTTPGTQSDPTLDSQVQMKLSQARQVLDQEVRYSEVLTRLGQAMPANTILDALELTNELFSSSLPTTLKVYAKTTSDTTMLTRALESSGVAASVSVQATEPTGGIDGYPVSVSLTVVFMNKAGS